MMKISFEVEQEDYEIIQRVFAKLQQLYHAAGLQKSITENYSGDMAGKIIAHLCVVWEDVVDGKEDGEGEEWKHA